MKLLHYFACSIFFSFSSHTTHVCQTPDSGTWNKQTPSCIQGDEMITVIIMLLIINLVLSLYNTNLNVDAKSCFFSIVHSLSKNLHKNI